MKPILIRKVRILLIKKVLEVVDENLSKTTRDNILNSELSLIKGIVLEEKRRCVMISIIEGWYLLLFLSLSLFFHKILHPMDRNNSCCRNLNNGINEKD